MSSAVRSIGLTVWELLVEDGQLAVGIVASLAITWVLANTGNDSLVQITGWILLALLVALMLANLARAARNARRKMSASQTL